MMDTLKESSGLFSIDKVRHIALCKSSLKSEFGEQMKLSQCAWVSTGKKILMPVSKTKKKSVKSYVVNAGDYKIRHFMARCETCGVESERTEKA